MCPAGRSEDRAGRGPPDERLWGWGQTGLCGLPSQGRCCVSSGRTDVGVWPEERRAGGRVHLLSPTDGGGRPTPQQPAPRPAGNVCSKVPKQPPPGPVQGRPAPRGVCGVDNCRCGSAHLGPHPHRAACSWDTARAPGAPSTQHDCIYTAWLLHVVSPVHTGLRLHSTTASTRWGSVHTSSTRPQRPAWPSPLPALEAPAAAALAEAPTPNPAPSSCAFTGQHAEQTLMLGLEGMRRSPSHASHEGSQLYPSGSRGGRNQVLLGHTGPRREGWAGPPWALGSPSPICVGRKGCSLFPFARSPH